MQVIGAGDVTRSARTSPHVPHGLTTGFDHYWVASLAKIIIRTPHDDFVRAQTVIACDWIAVGDTFQIGEYAIASFPADAVQGSSEIVLIGNREGPRCQFRIVRVSISARAALCLGKS